MGHYIPKIGTHLLDKIKNLCYYYNTKLTGGDAMEKKVLINKTIMDEDHHYYKANVAANKEAMRVLTKSGFYLYTYFMQNDNGWNPILRRTHVMKETGLSKSSYYDAIADLIEYGYLVETNDGYEFYELPEDNEL